MPAKKTPVKTKSSAQRMADALVPVLANTYVLAVKSHVYHWNVTGPLFKPLHDFCGDEYEALFEAADDLAERIRALGPLAPTGMAELLAAATIGEAPAKPQTAKQMLADLLKSHEEVVQVLQAVIELADDLDDDVTEDMLIQRKEVHDKTLWMLKSQLQG